MVQNTNNGLEKLRGSDSAGLIPLAQRLLNLFLEVLLQAVPQAGFAGVAGKGDVVLAGVAVANGQQHGGYGHAGPLHGDDLV